MRIEIIPCLQDNYSYLIIDESNNSACIIDPSEAEPIINFLKNKNINIRGLEISKEKVQECIAKGLTVIEGNAEKDLKQFPDKSFDYVVLSQTLQACLLYTSPSPRDRLLSRMPSSA